MCLALSKVASPLEEATLTRRNRRSLLRLEKSDLFRLLIVDRSLAGAQACVIRGVLVFESGEV
jgi:hypothetical protein